jgi:hypothetical protein
MVKRYPTVAEKRAQSLAQMKRTEAHVGADLARFRPLANNMAAGPCAACLAIEEHAYRADEAPLMPLPECPHPDQCVGCYRLEVEF